jgi:hypothetical protein
MQRTNLYRHFDADGALLYVGISFSAVTRLKAHMNSSDWACDIAPVTIETHPTREAALEAEKAAIRRERPAHNKVHMRPAPVQQYMPKTRGPMPCAVEVGPAAPWVRYAVGSNAYAEAVGADHSFTPATPYKIDLAKRVARAGDVVFVEGEGAAYV